MNVIDLAAWRRGAHYPPPGGCNCPFDEMACYASSPGELSPPIRRPYIAEGCGQQGRYPERQRASPWPHFGLTEATLDRRIAEKRETRPLPELLLAKGAMTGPHVGRGLLPLLRRALHAAWLRIAGPRL